jgi:hypothetical protein
MIRHRIDDIPFDRKISEIILEFPEDKVPKIIWDETWIEIKNNDFTVHIKLNKEWSRQRDKD